MSRRLSPITIGGVLVALFVVTGAVYLAWSLRSSARVVEAPPAEEMEPSEPPATGGGPERRRAPVLAPSVRRAASVEATPAAPLPGIENVPGAPEVAVALAPVDGGVLSLIRHRSRVSMAARRRFRLTIRADEAVFDKLNLDGDTRTAIRRITSALRFPTSPSGSDDSSASIEKAEATRRAAIQDLLGAERTETFYAAESKARDEVEAALNVPSPDVAADPLSHAPADAAVGGPTPPAPASNDDAAANGESHVDGPPPAGLVPSEAVPARSGDPSL